MASRPEDSAQLIIGGSVAGARCSLSGPAARLGPGGPLGGRLAPAGGSVSDGPVLDGPVSDGLIAGDEPIEGPHPINNLTAGGRRLLHQGSILLRGLVHLGDRAIDLF